LATLAASAQPLLAADAGADRLARLGLRPAAVIGDLDSISRATRAWLGEEVMVHRPDQDRTDLEKALTYAFNELNIDRMTVLAALGGRTDHEAGNLGLLARFGMGENLVFEGADHRILAIDGRAVLQACPGEAWSFWTYDPSVRVDLEGVRWPVHDHPLDAAGRPSISNQAIGDEVGVRARGGSVIVMRSFDLED